MRRWRKFSSHVSWLSADHIHLSIIQRIPQNSPFQFLFFLSVVMFSRVFIFSAVCFLGFFAVQCSAKFLLETIPTFPELTQLQSYVEQLPQLSAELSKVDNYTLLAPTNEAFDSWLGEANPQPTLDDIEATLYYHLLHGIYPVASFTSLPKFTASFLTNSSYTNVTAGQTAQLSQDSRNFQLIRSGNGTNTSITSSVRSLRP